MTHPMILDDGATHYRPISWDAALRETAAALRGLADPDEAIFYTPGRTSNEAAFLYQLLVRGFGTSRRSPNRNSESTVCDQTDRLNSGRDRGSRGIRERVHHESTNVCTIDGATCRTTLRQKHENPRKSAGFRRLLSQHSVRPKRLELPTF